MRPALRGGRSRPRDLLPPATQQALSLLCVAARQLLWGLPAVAREVRCWRARARAIPDLVLRTDALGSLAFKRASADGAALFWTLPPARSSQLLRLLVAYEVMADFLDSVNERAAHVGTLNGRQLHLALSEALAPGTPASDYYHHNPRRADGGYLGALLGACRTGCALLPSYRSVAPFAIRAATLTQVLGLNHELNPAVRDEALREWAASHLDTLDGLVWFELTAAASAWLTILALLALAAGGEECDESRAATTYAAYLPWISLAGTMLDSYVDQAQDAAEGDHSYVAHYACAEEAVERLGVLVREAALRARALPNGARHGVLVASMVAMYLSKDSARTPQLRASTLRLAAAGGSLARVLLPVLRLWRVAYAQRDE